MEPPIRRCQRCGYDGTGLPNGVSCPECQGVVVDESEAFDRTAIARRKWRLVAVVTIPWLIILTILIVGLVLGAMYAGV